MDFICSIICIDQQLYSFIHSNFSYNVLTELLAQQAEHQAKAISSRNKQMAIAEMKNTTIEDLTKGLFNYKYLGLTFERVKKEGELL